MTIKTRQELAEFINKITRAYDNFFVYFAKYNKLSLNYQSDIEQFNKGWSKAELI
jgi:hypothetical protein